MAKARSMGRSSRGYRCNFCWVLLGRMGNRRIGGQMAETSAEQAVVNAFTPLCVARAEEEPEQLLLLREESRWARRGFVEEAGWVANVNEDYRSAVATECAAIVVEGMDPEPDAAPAD